MDLLFSRHQSRRVIGDGFNFNLHAKIELSDEERSLVNRYNFDRCMLIEKQQPGLLRNAIYVAIAGYMVLGMLFAYYTANTYRSMLQLGLAGFLLLLIPVCLGFLFYHQQRETIYVENGGAILVRGSGGIVLSRAA